MKGIVACLIAFLSVGVFVLGNVVLSVSPRYTLPGGEVTIVLTLPSTENVKNVRLNMNYGDQKTILYNPIVNGTSYKWTYITSKIPYDYTIQGLITYASTTVFSNMETFSTKIPAVDVSATIVYLPFISQATKTWCVKVKNIGSKPLTFSLASTSNVLIFSPSEGEIMPKGEKKITIIDNGSTLLPGKIYVLRAFLNTNDPRKDQNHIAIATIIEGPDGIVLSPVEVPEQKVSVGSDVSFGFSVFKHGVDVTEVSVNWKTPKSFNTFYFKGNGTYFSSHFIANESGMYTLASINVSYIYKNSRKVLSLQPRIALVAYPSSKNLRLNLNPTEVGIEVTSSSTPFVHVKDGSLNIRVNVTKVASGTWKGAYNFRKVSGPVSVYATFDDVNYAIVKRFERHIVNSALKNISFDGGWVNIPQGTFSSTTLMITYFQPLKSTPYYRGYEFFNAVSDMVEVLSEASPAKMLTYNLNLNLATVNGLFDKVKVYSRRSEKWIQDDIPLSIHGGLATFQAGEGTYALGIVPSINNEASPRLTYFTIMPRNSSGQNVQFFVSANEDCYYTLKIFDLRGRVILKQDGKILGKTSNLIYTLDPHVVSGGLYVAVVSVGNSPSSVESTMSESFTVTE